MADELRDEKAGDIRFTPSVPFWKYLGWLSRNTLLGRNENDVARQILTSRLAEMRHEEYSDGQKP